LATRREGDGRGGGASESTVVFGVTGGIAAYKAASAVSALRQRGARVFVVMTEAATRLVGPATFRALSGNPVFTDAFDPRGWAVGHIGLADEADVVVVAPATANIVGKIAAGVADDLLTTLIMATRAPVLLAPSMNVHMYENPIFQRNLNALRGYGYRVVEPGEGRLACGYEGRGRMAEPEELLREIEALLPGRRDLEGVSVLVTAGPTREHIDPVRFLSSPSSGRMGFAVAESACRRGADVVLVSGPTELPAPPGVELVRVVTAAEMHRAVLDRLEDADVVVMAAAVSDFAPSRTYDYKVKKEDAELVIPLNRTPDILADVGRNKGHRYLVGFAAETEDVVEGARTKLEQKGADLIVANDLSAEGSGFATTTNRVTIVDPSGAAEDLPLLSKREVADRILDRVVAAIGHSRGRSPATGG